VQNVVDAQGEHLSPRDASAWIVNPESDCGSRIKFRKVGSPVGGRVQACLWAVGDEWMGDGRWLAKLGCFARQQSVAEYAVHSVGADT
jgi:hypothetical protein